MKVRVFFTGRSAKRTEAASDKTDIRNIDVAIYDVGHYFTDSIAPHLVGCKDERFKRVTTGATQRQPFTVIKLAALERFVERTRDRWIDQGQKTIEPARFIPKNIVQHAHP